MIDNIQNKICSFNIIMNDTPITKTPILFRINENGNRNIEDIIYEHREPILNKIYEMANDLDDLINTKISGIVYDIDEKDDKYETHEIDISKYIDYNDNRLENILINKINNYSDLLLMKANLFTEKGRNFKESYKIICEANDNNINKETFIQYILSCVNKEYGNKFSNVIDGILRKEFK